MNRCLSTKVWLTFAATLATVTCGWAADLPAGKYTEWTSEKEIFVPMRDGVHLSTDVFRPKGAEGKLPTVLIRTPYPKDNSPESYLKQGYAVVVQNERGRYFSEGDFKNYLQGASTDGYDTVEWIVKQPWSNGKVGSIGCSSPAETQWPMAASNPPGFAAMVPIASGAAVGNIPGNETRRAFYRGGVPWYGMWVWWYGDAAPRERLLLPPNSSQEQRIRLRNTYSLQPTPFLHPNRSGPIFEPSQFMHLPSKDILRERGGALTAFDEYITWTPADARWNKVEQIGAGARPRVPALHMNTWHDFGVAETTRLFKYLQDLGTPNQSLIIGAGPHCAIEFEDMISDMKVSDLKSMSGSDLHEFLQAFSSLNFSDLKFGDLEVGDARYAGVDHGYAKLFLNWFDYWLKGEPNRVTDMPKVQLYVMGKGWISSDRWPLPETRFTQYYLGSRLHQQAGILSISPPSSDEKDSYIYDPAFPTPSLGGGGCCAVALDQRPTEARKDVLLYSTPPLEKPVTIAGPVDVVLFVSSSAKDTDFMVKLVDVYPDGKAINLSEDAFRVRYRKGFGKKVLMQPDAVYKISLSNMVTAIRFPKGHRIRLDVSSSNFPLYERNLNTGGNNYDETSWVVAENSVHHGPQYPSHIVLPVLAD